MIATDTALLRALIEAGQASPALHAIVLWLTELGGAPVVWTLTALAVVLLWRRDGWRPAALMLAIPATGRGGVELLKSWTARARPDLIEHVVSTHSLSLPSGHAANAMLVYLTVAMLLGRGQPVPVAAAVVLAVAIGLTRPILGVHWPSDVLAGWLLGAGWTLLGVGLGSAARRTWTLSP